MTETDELQIALEIEIADAIKRFESASGLTIIDIWIDQPGDIFCCIGTSVEAKA